VQISAWTREGLPAEGTLKFKSVKALKKSNQVINGVMNAYLSLLGSTCIYRVLIMSGYAMDRALARALVWAVSGSSPNPGP